jgi:tetrahydrodipicolinate N-succinyltransferase
MKYMAIHHETQKNVRFRATAYKDFSSFLDDVMWANEENVWNYYVENVMVSYDQARAAVDQAFADAKTKKELTHKRVRISQGATCLPNTYREIWVKK